ncbi:50S ribosomal protein L17 [Candidatus Uhrbacteria bacterium]|nr:50S ribosomal protein L17 [Candidatus Uhrbacteria bacterium]
MRHRRHRTSLGLKSARRKALLKDLVNSVVLRNRIKTTLARAKATKPIAERMITLAKVGSLHARRQIISRLQSRQSAKRLIEELAPLYKDINGGYTRIIHFDRRMGDGAKMALLEFTKTPASLIEAEEKKKKRKKESSEKKRFKAEKPKEDPKKRKEREAKAAEDEKKKKKPSKKVEAKETDDKPKDETEEKYRGPGFLGGLRRFLKGD